MEHPSLDDMYSANNELKRMVDSLLDGIDEQVANLPGVVERLSTSRSSQWSADRRVEVTVDAYGIVLSVRLADDALSGTTPEKLAAAMTEAAKAAAATAQRRRAEIVAPITDATVGLPDLPDLYPGAPSLREIRTIVSAAAQTSTQDPSKDTEDQSAQED